MSRFNRSTRGQLRERWLAEFERRAIARRPELRGRLCWDTAVFLFNQGLTPTAAADRAAERTPRQGDWR